MTLLLRILLGLYPRAFRREFADEMITVLTDRWARTRSRGGTWGLLTLLAREAPDLLKHAFVEHTNQGAQPSRKRRRGKRSDEGKGGMFEHLEKDIRYAVRTLARAPGFTATVVGTLALGIGANTAIFSVVHAVLLTPPPYESPDELMMVWEQFLPRDRTQNVISPRNFRAWQEQNEVFSGIAAMDEDPRKSILMSDYIKLLERAGWEITHFIDCPLSSQRFLPNQVKGMQKNRTLGVVRRTLIVGRKR